MLRCGNLGECTRIASAAVDIKPMRRLTSHCRRRQEGNDEHRPGKRLHRNHAQRHPRNPNLRAPAKERFQQDWYLFEEIKHSANSRFWVVTLTVSANAATWARSR
jgi:hypothetical protein